MFDMSCYLHVVLNIVCHHLFGVFRQGNNGERRLDCRLGFGGNRLYLQLSQPLFHRFKTVKIERRDI